MIFEKTDWKDLDAVAEMVLEARARIGMLGIDQWQNTFPSRDVLADDITRGRSYVAKDGDGSLCATFAVIDDGEPTYDKIYDGAWQTSGNRYLAVHRVAVSSKKLRCGVAGAALRFVEEMARRMGRESVRIDTHIGNTPMRGMLERNGYVYCGSIYLENGDHRVAYEKCLG